MEHYIPHMEHYNIHIEIFKKNASRLLYTFFKDTNFQKWDFYITWDTGSFSMIPSLDETRQTMKDLLPIYKSMHT